MTLEDRISWVLEHRKDVVRNESQWSLAAGLKRTHLNTIRRRLRDFPDADHELATLNALADAAQVSRAWFILGEGSPDGLSSAPAPQQQPSQHKMPPAFYEAWATDWWAPPRRKALDIPTPKEQQTIYDEACETEGFDGLGHVTAQVWANDFYMRLKEMRKTK